MAFPSPSVWLPIIWDMVVDFSDYWSGKTQEEKVEATLLSSYRIEQATYGDWDAMSGSVAAALSHPSIGLDAINEKLDSILANTVGVTSPLELVEAKVGGLYTDMPTVLSMLDSIFARVAPGEDPPPISTSNDSARILAALYYIACAVVVPAWMQDNEEVMTGLGAMMTSITEQHGDIVSDVASLSLQASGSHDILAAKADDIRAVEDDIIAAIGEPVEAIGGATGYPGLADVTFASAVPWTGPQQITATMDGCLVEFTTMPAGTGHNDIGSFTNWQHAGWLAFLDDQGYADEVQWLGMEKANYCPKRMASASAVLVFPRPSSGGTLTPWTRAS